MFPGLSTLGVLAIVFLAIGLKAPMIVAKPLLLALVAVPLVIFYALGVRDRHDRRSVDSVSRCDAVAVVYGSVMRNLSIALGIAVASFGPEAALVLAGAYIVQVQGAAWYVKVADRVLGPVRRTAPRTHRTQLATCSLTTCGSAGGIAPRSGILSRACTATLGGPRRQRRRGSAA